MTAYDRWWAEFSREEQTRRFALEVTALAKAKVTANKRGRPYAVCWYTPPSPNGYTVSEMLVRVRMSKYNPKKHKLIAIVRPETP